MGLWAKSNNQKYFVNKEKQWNAKLKRYSLICDSLNADVFKSRKLSSRGPLQGYNSIIQKKSFLRFEIYACTFSIKIYIEKES